MRTKDLDSSNKTQHSIIAARVNFRILNKVDAVFFRNNATLAGNVTLATVSNVNATSIS